MSIHSTLTQSLFQRRSPLSEAPLIPPLAPTAIAQHSEDWAQRGSAGKLTLPLCGDACQSPLVANHRWGYIKGALSRAKPRDQKPWQPPRHEKMRSNRFRGRVDCPLHIWSFGVSSPKSQGFPTHPPTLEHQERKCWAMPQHNPAKRRVSPADGPMKQGPLCPSTPRWEVGLETTHTRLERAGERERKGYRPCQRETVKGRARSPIRHQLVKGRHSGLGLLPMSGRAIGYTLT